MTSTVWPRHTTSIAALAGGPAVVGAALFLSPIAAGVLVAGTLVAGAIVLWPVTGLMISAAVVPLERIGRLTDDSTMYTFSLMRAVGLITLVGLSVHLALGRRDARAPRPLWLYGAYVGVALLSLAHASDRTYGIRAASAMLGNLLFLFVTINLIRKARHAHWVIGLWLLTTTAISFFTVYQWHNPKGRISDDRFQSTGERTQDQRFAMVLYDSSEYEVLEDTPRALGSTSHPAVYGINVILSLPFFAWFLRITHQPGLRLVIAGAAALTAYNAVLTNTRAVLVTLVATLLFIALCGLIRIRLRTLGFASLLAVALLPAVPSEVYERTLDPRNYQLSRSETMQARFAYWTEAVQIIQDHWLFGVGIGNQTELPRRLGARMHMPPNSTVHNEYLQSLMETGIVGYPWLVAFVASLSIRCRRGARLLLQLGRTRDAWLMRACFVALLSVMVFGAQVDVLHFPLKGWWLAMGVAIVLFDEASRSHRSLSEGGRLRGDERQR